MSKLEKIKLDMLSIDGKFPGSTHANTSLKRIRGTINAYVESMSRCGWWSTFKPGTVRALERRLNMHERAVKAGLHVDTMTAFEQLQRRVNAMLTIHKVLSQWVRGEADGVLEQMFSHLPHVLAYMNYVKKDFGEDLQVAVAKCEFNIVFRTTGSMYASFRVLKLEHLAICFQASAAQAPDSELTKKGGARRRRARYCSRRKSRGG